jgi:hypothetical protein
VREAQEKTLQYDIEENNNTGRLCEHSSACKFSLDDVLVINRPTPNSLTSSTAVSKGSPMMSISSDGWSEGPPLEEGMCTRE